MKTTGSLVFLSLWVPNKNNPKGVRKIITGIDQQRLVFFVSCDFLWDFTKMVSENWWFKSNPVNFMYYWPNNSIRRHCEHKHLEIKQFDTLHNLWQVVQNVYFAKSQEKPHKKLIFKHFGLSVPNLRKQNPARIRIRMTQKIILHGEPAFLKQSPLGWYRVVRLWELASKQV